MGLFRMEGARFLSPWKSPEEKDSSGLFVMNHQFSCLICCSATSGNRLRLLPSRFS